MPVGSRPNWRVRRGAVCRLVPSDLGGQAHDFAASLTDLLNDSQFYETQLRAEFRRNPEIARDAVAKLHRSANERRSGASSHP